MHMNINKTLSVALCSFRDKIKIILPNFLADRCLTYVVVVPCCATWGSSSPALYKVVFFRVTVASKLAPVSSDLWPQHQGQRLYVFQVVHPRIHTSSSHDGNISVTPWGNKHSLGLKYEVISFCWSKGQGGGHRTKHSLALKTSKKLLLQF